MTSSDGDRSPTRTRILDAGQRLWVDEPPEVLFGGFTVSRVARAAGVTRATFYSYWSTAEEYLLDLADHVGPPQGDDYSLVMATAAGSIGTADHGGSVVREVVATSEQEFERLLADPGLRARLAFLSQMDDPAVAERLRERYRGLEELRVESFETLWTSWAREPRPPFNDRTNQALYVILGEGMAAHHLIDPEVMPAELYPLVLIGLMMFVTRRRDDARTMAELAEHMNSWPTTGMHLRREGRDEALPPDAPIDPDMIAEVVRTARRLQGVMGWNELTLAEIGSVSGISDEALLRAFGSKAGLALAIYDLNVRERLAQLADTGDPLADLCRTLDLAGDELRRSPAIARSALEALAGITAMPTREVLGEQSLRTALVRHAAAAQAAGQLRDDRDPAAIASALVRVLVVEQSPATSPNWPATELVEIVLDGLTPCATSSG